jgi:hypothetical protein
MKLKELLEALQGVDPEKELGIAGTYDAYEITGVYVGETYVDIEIERTT